MNITTSSRSIGAITQKLLGLSVSKRATQICQVSGPAALSVKQFHHPCQSASPLLSPPPQVIHLSIAEYSTSFFVKHTAKQLWKGVTSVSNAGKKRGRGKGVGKKTAKDLNRGQVIGVGKTNIVWPGLNAPIIRGKELVERKQLPPDPDREAKLIKMRDTMGRFRPLLLSPMERGWSGTKMHGRFIGPPDPIGEDNFEGFDTVVLEMKTVANMDANYGRVRRFSVLTFTGNKNGLAGFALAKSPDGRGAIRRSKNRAGQKLVYIERFNNHTVLHDFFTQFGKTRIFVYKKPEGFGLVCHRAIREMCKLIGIKDVYAKVEGSYKNVQHITKAFMLGLIQQRTHAALAEEKGLYLVEQRADHANYPEVIAVPSKCRTEKDIHYNETLNFSQVGFNDRIPERKKPFEPFYKKLPSWENHLMKTEWRRNHGELKRFLMRETGGIKSHFTEKYPEADGTYAMALWKKRRAEAAAAEDENN